MRRAKLPTCACCSPQMPACQAALPLTTPCAAPQVLVGFEKHPTKSETERAYAILAYVSQLLNSVRACPLPPPCLPTPAPPHTPHQLQACCLHWCCASYGAGDFPSTSLPWLWRPRRRCRCWSCCWSTRALMPPAWPSTPSTRRRSHGESAPHTHRLPRHRRWRPIIPSK